MVQSALRCLLSDRSDVARATFPQGFPQILWMARLSPEPTLSSHDTATPGRDKKGDNERPVAGTGRPLFIILREDLQ